MRCEDLNQVLISGENLNEEMREHLSGCHSCRSLSETLTQTDAPPSAQSLDRIRTRLHTELKPVRPLASDRALTIRLLILFVALAVAAAPVVHTRGMMLQPQVTRVVMLAVIGLSAWVSALAVVQLLVPGSRRRLPPVLGIILPMVVLALVAPFAFPSWGMARFIARGLPCMRMGILCAIPAAIAGALLLRRGYATNRRALAAVGGGFAGLLGVTALDMHCPIFDMGHVLVWHLGVIAVCAVAGFLFGAGYDTLKQRD